MDESFHKQSQYLISYDPDCETYLIHFVTWWFFFLLTMSNRRILRPELLNIRNSKSSDISGCCHWDKDNSVVLLAWTVRTLNLSSVSPLYLLNFHIMTFSSGTKLRSPIDALILKSIVSGGAGILRKTFLAHNLVENKDSKVILKSISSVNFYITTGMILNCIYKLFLIWYFINSVLPSTKGVGKFVH